MPVDRTTFSPHSRGDGKGKGAACGPKPKEALPYGQRTTQPFGSFSRNASTSASTSPVQPVR